MTAVELLCAAGGGGPEDVVDLNRRAKGEHEPESDRFAVWLRAVIARSIGEDGEDGEGSVAAPHFGVLDAALIVGPLGGRRLGSNRRRARADSAHPSRYASTLGRWHERRRGGLRAGCRVATVSGRRTRGVGGSDRDAGSCAKS